MKNIMDTMEEHNLLTITATIIGTALVTAFLTATGYFIINNFTSERQMGIQVTRVAQNAERISDLDARVKLIEGKYEELLKLTITIDTKMDVLLGKNGANGDRQ